MSDAFKDPSGPVRPVFSPSCDLFGWVAAGSAVFDPEMVYCAFIAGGHAWRARDLAWLGSVDGLTLRDREGRPLAWNPDWPVTPGPSQAPLARPLRPKDPMRPKRPLPPRRPLFPRPPIGGWSEMSFTGWLEEGLEQQATPS